MICKIVTPIRENNFAQKAFSLVKIEQQISDQTSEIWPKFKQHRLVMFFLGCL